MKIGDREFDTENHTYVMGILNVTPDSFSDGGRWECYDDAMKHAGQLAEEGADVIDIGGESTRPGHVQICAQEEIERIVPVVEGVRENFDIPISVDTYKSQVAEAALQAGAKMVNDIWGFRYDERMAEVVQSHRASCCLMHNRSKPAYRHLLEDMVQDLQVSIGLARGAGIDCERILLDPGIGFGKTYEMNLDVMRHLDVFQKLGFPLLLGTSRKSMIGLALDLPVDKREEGTLVTTVLAVLNRYGFVRVHDVKKNKRAITMTEKIMG